nr:ribokinase [uncultured bacterium]
MAIAKKWDVLALGVTSVDDLLYVAEFPAANAKTRVLSSDRQCGGLSATALVAASRLGACCAFAGALGENALSQFVESTLVLEGIDTNFVTRRDDASPVHATIVVDTSTGTRNIFAEHKGFTGADAFQPDDSIICATRVLFVDHHGIEGTIRAAKIARENCIPVVADFERLSAPRFSELMDLVDHLILSSDFACHLTGQETPERAARSLWTDRRAVVVITCGESGCWVLSSEMSQPQHFPAFAVEIVDTTGCGDVFHGAYAGTLAQGMDLENRIRVASAAAALKATQPGGQKGIPLHEELEEFLSTQT